MNDFMKVDGFVLYQSDPKVQFGQIRYDRIWCGESIYLHKMQQLMHQFQATYPNEEFIIEPSVIDI